MKIINSHKLDFLVGVVVVAATLLSSQCNAAIVSYVYNPICTVSPGCSFTDKIWNTTNPITEGDDVIIESNVTITISIYNTTVSIASLTVGLFGAPVTLQIMNSTLILTGDTNGTSQGASLNWGDDCQITTYYSNITFVEPAFGGTGTGLYLYYSYLYAPLALDVSNLTMAYSEIETHGALTLNYTVAQFSIIRAYDLLTTTFYSYSNELNIQALILSDYAIIYNNTGLAYASYPVSPIDFTLAPYTYMEIYDTVTILDTLEIGEGSYFTFQTSKPDTNLLFISYTDAKYESELNIGDNSYVMLQDGNINNLTLGDGINIVISAYTGMVISNIEQLANGSFANITIRNGDVQVWTRSYNITGSLYASIYVQSPSTLTVRTMLFMSNGSRIEGGGLLYIAGTIVCSYISIHTVKIALDETVITVDTLKAALIYPNYVGSSPVVVNGNVIISPEFPNDGIKFSEMFKLSVSGNFSQVGGHMNFSVHEKYKGSSAYLQVAGTATMSNVTLGIVTDTATVQATDRWFLVQANQLLLSNISIFDVYANLSYHSYYYTQQNGLYLGYHVPTEKGWWLNTLTYFLIFGGSIVLLIVFMIIVITCQRRSQRQYDKLASTSDAS